jgi:hypothetical protein
MPALLMNLASSLMRSVQVIGKPPLHAL